MYSYKSKVIAIFRNKRFILFKNVPTKLFKICHFFWNTRMHLGFFLFSQTNSRAFIKRNKTTRDFAFPKYHWNISTSKNLLISEEWYLLT